jgi:thiaminase
MTEFSLTSHLIALDPPALSLATTHPFLIHAAQSTLPTATLTAWLAQDRLYALNYISFASSLLSKISIPTSSNRQSTLEWRVATAIVDCLTNVRTEVTLFEEVAEREEWSAMFDEARPNTVTRMYADLFDGAATPRASLLKGMVTLWATEACYLQAWSYAASQMGERKDIDEKDVMRGTFIPNWSSQGFREFVQVLEDLVNEMGRAASENDIKEAEDTWRQVLAVEEKFWPETS